MRLLISIVVFLCVISSTSHAEPIKLTYKDAMDHALAANKDIAAAKQKLAELEGMKGEARAAGLPQLTGVGQYQRIWENPEISINDQTFKLGKKNSYVAGAKIDQLLWDGGRVFKAVKAARTEEEKGLEDIRNVEEIIRLSVTETFYQTLYTDKIIEVLNRQLKQLKDHLNSIKIRYKQGMDSDYTLMRQEVEVSNVEPMLIDAEKNREYLLNSLKVLMSMPQEEEIELEGKLVYDIKPWPKVESLIEKAKAQNPDISANKLREKSLVQNVGVEKSGYWPSLSAQGSYEWQGQADKWKPNNDEISDALTTSVNLSWPIFDGLKTYSRVKQAKAKLIAQSAQTKQLEDSIMRDVRSAHIDLKKSESLLKSQETAYELAKKATRIASTRFKEGLMSQLELNDTINSEARAEQLYYKAIYDCISAEANLVKAVGGGI